MTSMTMRPVCKSSWDRDEAHFLLVASHIALLVHKRV
jgi:hypothetical protein